jgi:hypothetical protein
MKNQIGSNNLRIDLDCPYNKEENQIEVYSSVYWTAKNKKEYSKKEDLITNYKIDNGLFSLYSWCDVSGYNYWVIQQEEENYVSIDVVLKKPVKEYSNQEIELIKEAIIVADDYFSSKLL